MSVVQRHNDRHNDRRPSLIIVTLSGCLIVLICAVVAMFNAEHTSTPPHVERTVGVRIPIPYPYFAVSDGTVQPIVDYLTGLALEEAAAYAAVEAAARSTSSLATSTTTGAHSDAWWQAIAICEQGGRNDPYFGYFSIMDGSAGGLDWNTQVQMANAIIAEYGDTAWASACVANADGAAPGG